MQADPAAGGLPRPILHGNIHLAVLHRQEAPKTGGAAMANRPAPVVENRARPPSTTGADGKDSGQAPALHGDRPVAYREDAAMQAVQSTGADSLANGAVADTQVPQLPNRNDTMLSHRQFRDRCISRGRSVGCCDFVVHIGG